MKEQFIVEKPEEVKIIKIISHCPEVRTSHPGSAKSMGWSNTNYYKVLGLGSDSKIYEHNDYDNSWSRNDVREVPDACTCGQGYGLARNMLCWFCMKKVFDDADKTIEDIKNSTK